MNYYSYLSFLSKSRTQWQTNFNKKSLLEQTFHLVETILSYFFQTLLPPKVTFTSSENIFFNKSVIPATGNLFSVYGNSMLLFGAFLLLLEIIIEIRGNQFQHKLETIFGFFARRSGPSVQWKRIFQRLLHSGQWKRNFWLVQTISFFPSSGNVFFNESFIPAFGEGFFLQCEPSALLESSFLQAETVTDMGGNHFSKTDLKLARETHFVASENHFLPLPQIFFKKFFILANRNTLFSPEEKLLQFTQNFLSCWWKPLFKLQRSLFKILITAIGNNFL